MRAHYIQHVPFEGLGSIETWLQHAGYEISGSRLFQGEQFPDVGDMDLLVVLGGPMSIHDEAAYPWLVQEKAYIRQAIAAGISVLGICLGAQLIAHAMGGEVFSNPKKEIGWFPVEAVDSESDATFSFPKEINTFHWHGETFSLPKGAVCLAKSAVCTNQAFQIGRNVIGLQFHLETTATSAQAIIEHCRNELIAGEYIQSEADILSASQQRYASINRIMDKVLEYLQDHKS